MSRKRDTVTLDLFDWEPPEVVVSYQDEPAVDRVDSIHGRLCRAMALACRECGKNRDQIHTEMEEWLGRKISRSALDAWMSEARDESYMPALHLFALIAVTGDMRLLSVGPEMFDHAVVHNRMVPWIKLALAEEKRRELDGVIEQTRREAKRGVRS